MNSQQELLDAINTISGKQDRSFDTPATVLRVEGDTVWVHIDGGADETPALKTVNCEEGQTVQVRISSGSAFLVGNASAPPTDDTTANVAHFVAEQAGEKATEAIRSVEAIEQTVEGKVNSGDSNVTSLSSTMYQNANGVSIYNNTLAVGDSYAHIDGDSFDIKQATTAGTIDDANDPVVASFGQEVTVGTRNIYYPRGSHSQVFGTNCIAEGDYSHAEGYETRAEGDYSHAEGIGTWAKGDYSHAEGRGTRAFSDGQTVVGRWNAEDPNEEFVFIVGNGYQSTFSQYHRQNALGIDWRGNIRTTGNVKNYSGSYCKTPDIYVSDTIAAADTSYTFELWPESYPGYSEIVHFVTEDSAIDVYDTIWGFVPTSVEVVLDTVVITFPPQNSTHKIKLFIYN